jgi:hypothetical protein
MINKIVVQWPSGLVQESHNLAGDHIYEIKEGEEPTVIAVLRSGDSN